MTGFLLDEDLPARLTFTPSLPVIHTLDLGENPTDRELWYHARTHRLAILKKDTDFSDRILIAQPPPWIVHLRFGNLRRAAFHSFLAAAWPRIESLARDGSHTARVET